MPVLKTVQNARSRVDAILLYAMIGIVILGALCIMSAVNSLSWSNAIVRTHLVALPLGLLAFGVGWSFNYQIFDEQWKWLYAELYYGYRKNLGLINAVVARGLCCPSFPCNLPKFAGCVLFWYRLPS